VTEQTKEPMSACPRRNVEVATDSRAGKATALFAVVVDDEDAVCQLIAGALADLGIESSSFPTVKPAIASLDQRWPELVFLDIALDQSDAIDMIRDLGKLKFSGIVQLMSGGRPSLIEAVQRIGARHGLLLYPPLQKPFGADAIRELISRVRTAVEFPSRRAVE
jgi:DNA-binding NtrC family response regulator